MAFGLRQSLNFGKMLLGIKTPIYVQLALSKACNMRCRMCDAVRSRRAEQEMDLDQLTHLAAVLRKMGVGLLILTGGEPLLRKDLADVVAVFRRKGITVRIQSNGLLYTPEMLSRLRDAGLDGITLSLHSLDAETMSSITGVPDALPRILDAIAVYTQVFPLRNRLHGINTVVTAANIAEIPRMVEFTTRLGFAVSLIPVHMAQDDHFIVRGQDEHLFFRPDMAETVHAVYQRVIGMKKRGFLIYNSEYFLRKSPEFLINGRTDWRCASPELYFSISPSGLFLPCVDLKGRYSMLAPDFLAVWKSPDFRTEIHRQVGACRGCMYACYPEFVQMLNSRAFFLRQLLAYRKMKKAAARRMSPEEVRRVADEVRTGTAEADVRRAARPAGTA